MSAMTPAESMTSIELREAVARAICKANNDEPDEIVDRNYGAPILRWHTHVDAADAALFAIGKACAEVAKEMAAAADASGEPQAELAGIQIAAAILTLTGAAPDA